MFGRKKYDSECQGRYTGEGVIDGRRFNESGGTAPTDGIQVEAYIGFNTAHAGGNMRYPVYEYTVNGTTYRRAKTGVSYNSGHVAKNEGQALQGAVQFSRPGRFKSKIKSNDKRPALF